MAPLRAAQPQLHAQHHQLPTQVRWRQGCGGSGGRLVAGGGCTSVRNMVLSGNNRAVQDVDPGGQCSRLISTAAVTSNCLAHPPLRTLKVQAPLCAATPSLAAITSLNLSPFSPFAGATMSFRLSQRYADHACQPRQHQQGCGADHQLHWGPHQHVSWGVQSRNGVGAVGAVGMEALPDTLGAL